MPDNSYRPTISQAKYIINEMSDEVLVYSLKDKEVHSLNSTAAKVWNLCDGHNTVAEIAGLLSLEAGKPVDEDGVWLALGQLHKARLLNGSLPPAGAGFSRREAIRRLTRSAILVPLVSTILAPTPAYAQSAACKTCHMFNGGGGDTCATYGNCGTVAGICCVGNNGCMSCSIIGVRTCSACLTLAPMGSWRAP